MFPNRSFEPDIQLMYVEPNDDFVIGPGLTQIFSFQVPEHHDVVVECVQTATTQDSTLRVWITKLPLDEPIPNQHGIAEWEMERGVVQNRFWTHDVGEGWRYLHVKNLQNAENGYFLRIQLD